MARLSECPCGSGKYPSVTYDGYGIFMFYSCDKCHEAQLRKFRPDIFERYECDEPIDAE